MLAIDIIGLIITASLIGLRYLPYVFLASLIHEIGRMTMAFFLQGQVESVTAAGAFGATTVHNLQGNMSALLVIFSGPLANYIVSATVGGVEYEKTAALFNPFAVLKHPFAVINLRFAVLSILFNLKTLF
ncbi:Hypothetical protein LUCI_3247 [Lucifera butyrica]|uniref:Uncharacterized protein n=1 Tax=Lucifera butyrica TaxID=1351585 RepID=A0A498RCX5_9FIRM|nr:hypothetical protein [Lucifera butyrica]VBB07982.1 Hypothetical protein LUCI_3247 [Lucifera butyrica]